MQMLDNAAEKEASASTEQQDDEVELHPKKRKATSALSKQDKVCICQWHNESWLRAVPASSTLKIRHN